MKTKRMILDAAMLLLLPLLMAYSLIGEAFHEVAGTLMLALFLLHHWLNRGWWKALFKGRYSPQRVFQTTLNLLLLLFMIVQPLCGILMSKYLYTFLPTAGMASVARAIHLPLAYWGFVLMSLHAGTHLGSMLPKRKKRRTALVILSAISLYGVYAFFKRQIPDYMFLKMQFVFFDYSESRLLFLADYLAVMECFAVLGYGITQVEKVSRSVTSSYGKLYGKLGMTHSELALFEHDSSKFPGKRKKPELFVQVSMVDDTRLELSERF